MENSHVAPNPNVHDDAHHKVRLSTLLNVVLILTICTIVGEITSLLFEKLTGQVRKGGIVVILVQVILLIYLIIRYVDSKKVYTGKDYTKNPLAVWSQIAATALIGVAGIVFTVSNTVTQTSRENQDMVTELLSSREKSEMEFRQTIFKQVMDLVFDRNIPLPSRYYKFAVFQNNFHDLFNSRSIFDALWDEAEKNIRKQNDLENDSAKANKEILGNLIRLSKYTNAEEELLIPGKKLDTLLLLNEMKRLIIKDPDDDDTEFVEIKLCSIDKQADYDKHDSLLKQVKCTIRISRSESENDSDDEKKEAEKSDNVITINNINPVVISYFDSPLSNNFFLPDGHRIAVVLNDVKRYSARLHILHFPADYVMVGYRPSISRVNDLIREKK